jgi:hypothetical protein
MIVDVAFSTLVFNPGLFPKDLIAVCDRQEPQRRRHGFNSRFKVDFATSDREYRLTNQMGQQSGFHRANTLIENNHEGTFQGT